jgi:hypothetical protein
VSNPKAATTTSKGRTYGLELPEPWLTPAGHVSLWSITTIIGGGLPKPALVPWGMKSVAEYAVANYQRLFAMVKAAEGDDDALYQVVGWLKGAPYRYKEKKADLGTLLHSIAEARALQRPLPTITPDVAPLYKQFQRFEQECEPEWEMSEATVFNVRESCAGTLDNIGRLRGKRVPASIRGKLIMGDYKTGGEIDLADPARDKGVYPEVSLQMSAYAHSDGVYLAPGTVAPMPAVEGAVAIHITADGYRVRPVDIGEGPWRSFRYVRECFRFMEELSKTVIGEPLVLLPPEPAKKRASRKVAA